MSNRDVDTSRVIDEVRLRRNLKTDPTKVEDSQICILQDKECYEKTPSGSAAPKYKKYIFYDELSFLTPADKNEVDESLSETIPSPSASMNNTASPPSENTEESEMPTHLASSDTLQDDQNDHNSGSSQRPWNQKRKRRSQQSIQEIPKNPSFERVLLT
ncbi:hypothetical protein ACJJTC_017790 [Scirpophaga incertulas]